MAKELAMVHERTSFRFEGVDESCSLSEARTRVRAFVYLEPG